MSREGRAASGVVHSRVFTLPKEGHSAAEFEDACAWDARRGVFAVADGAGDSAYAGLWARLLVEQFVRTLPAAGDAAAWDTWIRPAQEAWAATDTAGMRLGDELVRIGYRGPAAPGTIRPRAYVELHIEQGPVLEEAALRLAS